MELITDISKHSYFFAVPCYDGKLTVECAASLIDTMGRLSAMQITNVGGLVKGGALIDQVRNELTKNFLDSGCDTMICIDSDIQFNWEAFQRLIVLSDHYPVVCGSYTTKSDKPEFLIDVAEPILNEHGLLPINGIGMGFVAIHRDVFSKLNVPTYWNKRLGDVKAFFQTGLQKEGYVGEDIFFFKRCVEAGIQPMLDPQIALKHVGTKVYDTPFSSVLNQIIL